MSTLDCRLWPTPMCHAAWHRFCLTFLHGDGSTPTIPFWGCWTLICQLCIYIYVCTNYICIIMYIHFVYTYGYIHTVYIYIHIIYIYFIKCIYTCILSCAFIWSSRPNATNCRSLLLDIGEVQMVFISVRMAESLRIESISLFAPKLNTYCLPRRTVPV